MTEATKETVIVVHGTWAAPTADGPRWWQPADDAAPSEGFITNLDIKLKQRGSAARCWAHCKDGGEIFYWTGENSWVDRAKAASAFRTYLQKLQNDGWTCHIVAHSHGGNVVVDALSSEGGQSGAPLGKLVTMGSPFLDVMPPILARSELVMKAIGAAAFLISLIVFSAIGYLIYDAVHSPYLDVSNFFNGWADIGFLLVWLVSLAVMAFILRRGLRNSRPTSSERKRPGVDGGWKLLAISSSLDEAWQTIHFVRNVESPLSPKQGIFTYMIDGLIADQKVKSDISRIHGSLGYSDVGIAGKVVLFVSHLVTIIAIAFTAYTLYVATLINWNTPDLAQVSVLWQWLLFVLPLFLILFFVAIYATVSGRNFLSAYWSPFRWCGRWGGSVRGVVAAAATYVVRGRAWPLLQSLALGLEGYRYEFPQVMKSNTFHCRRGDIRRLAVPSGSASYVRAERMGSTPPRRRLNDLFQHLGDFCGHQRVVAAHIRRSITGSRCLLYRRSVY